MNHLDLLNLFNQALATDFGIKVNTNNSSILKQRLYAARKKEQKNGNTSYNKITLKTSAENKTTELWLISK